MNYLSNLCARVFARIFNMRVTSNCAHKELQGRRQDMVWLGLSSGSGLSFERAEVRTWICNGVVANGYNANGRDSGKAGNEDLEAVLIAGVVRPI
jgi:hypothetical protein